MELVLPQSFRLTRSIENIEGRWMADVFVTDNATDEDVAVHYLGNSFESEEEANDAVATVMEMAPSDLLRLTWRPA